MPNLKIFAQTIDPKAADQIALIANHPAFADCKIRIMPDVHAGAGCVIGFTADLGDKVVPNIVGVDIGCGMLCMRLRLIHSLSDAELPRLDRLIHERIPSGFAVHDETSASFPMLRKMYCYPFLRDVPRIERSIGTLGGGNHFIEIARDEDDNFYLVIHTGSRNLGKQVAELYQRRAIDLQSGKEELVRQEQALIESYKATGRKREISDAIKALRARFRASADASLPKDLAYLTGEHRAQYLHDMGICQMFATLNRYYIASIILDGMGWESMRDFQTVHNYIDLETNIVRKGAVSAKKGENLIIPINMRDGSLLCVGKGNDDWNCSAPHGAGRIMSRTEARNALSMAAYTETMQNVFTTSVCAATLDESPMAYKPIDEIMGAIGDTVTIKHRLTPVYNFKAAEQ